nr:hypothetical protein [Opitutaceae bacterium]
MLREYAITPQVFSKEKHENDTSRRLALAQLYPELIEGAGVVRNLAEGAWEKIAANAADNIEGCRFLKALLQRKMVRGVAKWAGPVDGENDWIGVAQSEHAARPLQGVICSPAIPNLPNPLISRITHLDQCDWWKAHTSSQNLERTSSAYRKFFEPLFYYSREIMFVDRHLDPTKPNYAEFAELLRFLHVKNPLCRVSIHRDFEMDKYVNSPAEIRGEWLERFQRIADHSGHSFELVLRKKGAFTANFKSHDRYLISNMAILSLTNGFDTQKDALMTVTTWVDRTGEANRLRAFFEKKYGSDI